MRPGDLIKHRMSKYTIWRVQKVRADGLLEVERKTSRGVKRKLVTRPEEYVSMSHNCS